MKCTDDVYTPLNRSLSIIIRSLIRTGRYKFPGGLLPWLRQYESIISISLTTRFCTNIDPKSICKTIEKYIKMSFFSFLFLISFFFFTFLFFFFLRVGPWFFFFW